MAKKNLLFFLVIGLVGFFFLLIFTSGQHYLPYDNNKQYANYESFNVFSHETPSGRFSGESFNSYAHSSLRDSQIQNANATSMPAGFNSDFTPVYSSEKFPHCDVNGSEIIDPISNAATNTVDGNVCTGLTNSGGEICLTHEMAELLKTRGGNATGK